MYFRFIFILVLSLIYTNLIQAQMNLRPINNKEKQQLKNRILNNTDHFYFGIETGVLLDFSITRSVDPAFENLARNEFDGDIWKDVLFTRNGRFFLGYRFKSHYFEIAYGGYNGIARYMGAPGKNSITGTFGTIQVGYYYKLPIKSDFYCLSLGPEIGWAFSYSPYRNSEDYYENPPTWEFQGTVRNLLVGASVRNEFKLKKNLTFISRVNVDYIYMTDPAVLHVHETNPYPQFTEFEVAPLNFVTSFGLKFDFYSQKKKQQTFDQLGIEDPYQK